MMLRRSTLVMITMLVTTIAVAPALARQAATKSAEPAVFGKWTLEADTPHGKMTLNLELKRDPKDAKKLVGTMASDGMGEFGVTGDFIEGKLALKVTGGPSEMTLAGKFKDKDTLTGVLSGHAGDMAVVGTRVKGTRQKA